MRQRVMIGMSLLCEPVARHSRRADERARCDRLQAQILDLLRDRAPPALVFSIVLISHDLGVVASLADRVAVMYAGRIVESAPTAELMRDARHPYSALLMQV